MSQPSSDLSKHIGQIIGVSDWLLISQERVTAFAKLTQDEQWIHVDEARSAESPFGSTIVHGYLTLSLLSYWLGGLELFPKHATVLNYGLDKVRFLAPLKVGSRVRNHVKLLSVEPRQKGLLIKTENTVEIEGEEKPALVAESLALLLS